MKKMTEKQKARRFMNRKKFMRQNIEMTLKADECGERGLYEACDSYRKKARKAYDNYVLNGGR